MIGCQESSRKPEAVGSVGTGLASRIGKMEAFQSTPPSILSTATSRATIARSQPPRLTLHLRAGSFGLMTAASLASRQSSRNVPTGHRPRSEACRQSIALRSGFRSNSTSQEWPELTLPVPGIGRPRPQYAPGTTFRLSAAPPPLSRFPPEAERTLVLHHGQRAILSDTVRTTWEPVPRKGGDRRCRGFLQRRLSLARISIAHPSRRAGNA